MQSQNKVAVVTGAGSGIGRAVSLALQADGYSVVLAGRRSSELDETASQRSAAGGQMLAIPADVGKPAEVEALFAKTHEAFSRLDVLFNNAGTGAPAIPMEDLTYEQWSAIVNVNLTGPFLCAQQAIRLMKKQDPKGGRIIKQRFDLCACSASIFSSVYGDETRHYGLDKIDFA